MTGRPGRSPGTPLGHRLGRRPAAGSGGGQARAPKRARPTRTIVAPSSTAISKSSLIPIDSSATPRTAASSRSCANQRPGVVVRGAARSSGRRRRGRRPRSASTSAGTSCGRAPALLRLLPPGSPPRARGRRGRGGRSRRRARPGRPTASSRPTARAGAPCCAAAARGSASARPSTAGLRQQLLRAVLARRRRRRRRPPPARVGVDGLGGGDERDRRRVASGACRGRGDRAPAPRRRAPRPSRRSTLRCARRRRPGGR